jgi:hypothetical protein
MKSEAVVNQAAALNAQLRGQVERLWHKWLNRRGQRLNWAQFQQLLHRHPLLLPRIYHAWAGLGSPA